MAEVDTLLASVPNSDMVDAPLAAREAVYLTRIDGTRATIRAVFEHEAARQALPEDGREVLHYLAALSEADRLLKEL